MADGKEESSLNKNVPRFNGMNFTTWRPAMRAYLQMIEEQTNAGPPVVVLAGARRTWDALNARFRVIGTAGVFSNFSTAVKFKIHDRDNVPAKLGELDGLFSRITALNLAENLRAMIMLSALPDSWDQLASTLLGTIPLADLTPATIIPRIHEESARRKEHSSSNRLNVIKRNNSTSCDICHKNHSTQNHWYKPGDNQPSGSGSQNQQAGPSNHFQSNTRGNTRGRGRGRGNNNRGRGRGETGVANALTTYDEYGGEDFAHITDYDDENASNCADVTFPTLNPPAKEARNFFLEGIRSGTIRPNGF
ncbi:hypothetical protein PAXRUDRAFT_21090 [Paxillus rubicundulus Ve08.2h10]|uniref:Uncharacterized protein n=1 Tax=Paxillus rubicundulus Ve08.2h10 TaxID=930991 RepID=A0A0D0CQY2_9AGAM|nr:hypothetical protein PAXRUDRAFT_21090 [Paxillus rubicundulus Ve08.2h10]